ncbi:CapA family protein [Pseudomonas sp. sp1636]|uniref:CapA family protein n=1 Tax=Pseudomonas sp. sp1636 TaxID=3036707 RepID=UPI0025A5BE9F|nr:CapA family protein [Pseudomonas sp. sp1636]MDM8350253.1 CapA family protein [Pseudomonas sp. sp1636]
MHRASYRVFLGGDLMTARGVDQILPHPGDPRLYEAYVQDARDYVRLAERRNGPISPPVDFTYVWGVALQALQRRRVNLRLVNLETALTRRGQPQAKGINYRMNPANLALLEVAGIDCCVLANNHVLDWGEAGLIDTLHSLDKLGLQHAGAGLSLAAAETPAILPLADRRRLLLFAWATPDCGVPPDWAADERRPGVARLENLSAHSLERVAARIAAAKRPGDLIVVSLHWGGNWGFAIAPEQVRFAHGLIDQAGVDVLYGHSSHHIKALEVYRQRLILYGCGDLLDDYEGIDSHAGYRADLGLLYFAELAADGRLLALELQPTRQRRLSIQAAEGADRQWLLDSLLRECAGFACSVRPDSGQGFSLVWPAR